MSSDAHRNRLKPQGPHAKCKQCGVERAIATRADGLGKNCGEWKDRGLKIAEERRKAAHK